MTIRKVWGSRVDHPVAETFVGQKGTIFFNETGFGIANPLRISDGVTPGGNILANPAYTSTGTVAPSNPLPGQLWYNPTTKELWAYYNGAFQGTINAATPSTLGGIKAGLGVVVASDGTLSLDSTGIPFNFGDFYAFINTGTHDGACLSSINLDQDINIVSNGTGTINIIGEFAVYKTDGDVQGALSTASIFTVHNDGQVSVSVSFLDQNRGAFEIIGSTTELSIAPGQPGAMLHITGQYSTSSRVYVDGNNAYNAIVGRRWNGQIDNPTQVLAGEDILRLNATAQTNAGMPSTSTAQIRFYALETQSTTTQGSAIDFIITPIGQRVTNRTTSTTITSTGTKSLRFFGPVTGNADTASKLASPITINNVTFDGSANINIANTQTLTIGTGLTGTNYNGGAASTIALNTATLMTTSVNATTATSAATAYSLANTSTTYVGHAALADTATNAFTVTGASQSNITSLGTLTGLTVGGNFVTTGTIRYNVAYANSTATQLTLKSNPVTCNGRTGQIITSNAALNKGVAVQFTVFNNYITSSTDMVILNIASGASVGYDISVNNVSSTGTFVVNLHNSDSTPSGSNASDTLTINFAVLKVS